MFGIFKRPSIAVAKVFLILFQSSCSSESRMGLPCHALQTFQEENLESFISEHLELRKKCKLLKQTPPVQRLLTLFSSPTPSSRQNQQQPLLPHRSK